jgi:DNA-binding NarL/FixJ family response regulator
MAALKKNISLLIADDHGMLRDGLQDLLNDQKGFQVVGSVGSGEECLRSARQLKPDVILMDIKMPGLGGLEATRLVKAELPGVKVVILSTYEDEKHILDAFRAGADGYIPKTFPAAKMIESIHKLHRDGALVPDSVLPKLIRGVQALGSGVPAEFGGNNLTETEIKVLDLVKKGLQNKHIGREMGVSEKTVRNHLNNAFSKMGVRSRTEAIVKALQKGILALEE